MPPGKLGLIYSHTGIQKFLDSVGPARTKELFYTGRNITAERAEQIGLVHEAVAQDDIEGYAVELAAEIAGNAPLSLKGNKRIITELLTFPRLSETSRAGSHRPAVILLPHAGLPRRREGLRREAQAPLAGALALSPAARRVNRKVRMENSSAIVAAKDLHKYFGHGETAVHALDDVTVSLHARPVQLHHGAFGLGQVHLDALPRGPRPPHVRLRRRSTASRSRRSTTSGSRTCGARRSASSSRPSTCSRCWTRRRTSPCR